MNENKSATSFPSNKSEALTILYLQTKELKDITPEEFVQKYNDTYAIISKLCQGSCKVMDKSSFGI